MGRKADALKKLGLFGVTDNAPMWQEDESASFDLNNEIGGVRDGARSNFIERNSPSDTVVGRLPPADSVVKGGRFTAMQVAEVLLRQGKVRLNKRRVRDVLVTRGKHGSLVGTQIRRLNGVR